MSEKKRCILAVRVRGVIGAKKEIKDTLKMLRLQRNHHAVLIDDRQAYLGMLRMVQNFVTWGEASAETVTLLLKRRGRLVGNKKLSDEYAKKIGYESLEDLAKAIYQLKVEYGGLPGIKPVFRLHPPSKGFKGKVKKSYRAGGETGYRSEAINELVKRMV